MEHVNGQRHRRLVQRNELVFYYYFRVVKELIFIFREENFSIIFGHNATDDASANEEINRIFGRHIFGGNRGGGIRNSWVGRGGSGRGREFRTGGRWSGRDDEDYDEDSVTDGFGNGGFGGRGGGRSGMGRGAFTGRGACTGGRGACTGGRGFGSRREGIGRHLRRHSASENDNNTFANGGFGARMEQNRNNGLGRFGSRGGGLRGATNNNTNANGGGLRGGRCSHINETTEDSWNPNPVDGWGGFDGENGFTNGGFGGGNRSEEFANGGFGRGRGRGATRNNTQRELASTTEEGDVFANSGFSTVAINNEQEPRNIGGNGTGGATGAIAPPPIAGKINFFTGSGGKRKKKELKNPKILNFLPNGAASTLQNTMKFLQKTYLEQKLTNFIKKEHKFSKFSPPLLGAAGGKIQRKIYAPAPPPPTGILATSLE